MTKFEQIKVMDINELAKWINDNEIIMDTICQEQSACPYMTKDGDIPDDCDCTGCIKKWLESEVEGNET